MKHHLPLLLAAVVAASSHAVAQSEPAKDTRVQHGEYLVRTMLCNDCHTPWKTGPKGPEPDMSRMLSGHPQDLAVPPPPAMKGPWNWAGTETMTAFAGPWGISFTANLTPDKETGIGNWDADTFIRALRTGRHEGRGRPILPPMPWPWFAQATDDDLRAIFVYLQSLPPIRNRVPQPIDPPEAPSPESGNRP